jgi:beta-N-acetylhexosaminidase
MVFQPFFLDCVFMTHSAPQLPVSLSRAAQLPSTRPSANGSSLPVARRNQGLRGHQSHAKKRIGLATGALLLLALCSIAPNTSTSAAASTRNAMTFQAQANVSTPTVPTDSPASTGTASNGASSTSSTSSTNAPTAVDSRKIVCASAAAVIAQPMSWRMANLVVVSFKNTDLVKAQNLVKALGLGGILVRGTPRQSDGPALRKLRDIRSEMPSFVAVDEEGGRVQHLKKAIGPLPSALVMAKTKTAEQVRLMAKKHAVAMRAMGFNVDFGPVLDLYNGTANGIGDRAFSDSPDVVATYGRAFAQGLIEGGIFPVLKHWPGGGSADGDPHNKGTTTKRFDELKTADLLPFNTVSSAVGVGIMVGHQQVPGLSELPSSVSERAITQLLRAENRFNGLVITDSLSMWSIQYHWPAPKAAEMALRAGNDVLLFDDEPRVAQIVSALTDAGNADKALAARAVDANLRIMVAKGIPLCEGTTVTLPTLPKRPSA